MEYYQKAAEQIRSGEEAPFHLLKHAGLTAVGGGVAGAGAKAFGKLIPAIGSMINQYIPEKLSIAGLNKVDSRFGKFIQGALDEGYDYDEVREFLGDKIEKSQPKESKSESSVENQKESPFDLLGKYSHKLAAYFRSQLQAGEQPGIVRLLAQKEFSNEIKQIEKDHKRSFKDIINDLFEGKAPIQGSQDQPQQPAQPEQPQPQQGQQPIGPGQQKLMDMQQKLNQKLGV